MLFPGQPYQHSVPLGQRLEGVIRLDAVFTLDKDGNVYYPRTGPLGRIRRWWWWTFGKVE
jgi:hypothetical protein